MKHEQTPPPDILDLGLKMGSACLWFLVLAPIGIAIAFLWVFLASR